MSITSRLSLSAALLTLSVAVLLVPAYRSSNLSSEATPTPAADSASLAPTPPLGWNSYDAFGVTITESQLKEQANSFAKNLKSFGWQYVVIDAEWFVANPTPGGNGAASVFSLDSFGRYIPAENRYPSAAGGKGFKPLADYIHSRGLKFGIHIMNGIPKKAVEANSPIANSNYHAADAADTSVTCPWNPDNYDLKPSAPAAQAYYDSIAALYASWDVDFIKADCIASRPYRPDDIRMLSEALRKTGRPIVLSLSPGAAPIEKARELRKYSNLWRISDDVWDLWHSDVPYPQGLNDQFANASRWAGVAQAGAWPDADMLPIGFLGPTPGLGQPRPTRFTQDEQRTLLNLWCIIRSPLMIGANLSKLDPWTLSLLTNPEVLAVDQQSTDNRPVVDTDPVVIWIAETPAHDAFYVAAFNRSPTSRELIYPWSQLGLPDPQYSARDLWLHKNLAPAPTLSVTLPPHASVLYKLSTAAPH